MPAEEDWQKLSTVIQHWNSHRLDLFEISQPSKSLVFQGVMRFYLEDNAAKNSATKCLRVCSTSTTREVIETLLEKFRPDMKILSTPYCLYEVHAGAERKLGLKERPLLVQLHWTTDNREGRFVLRNEQDILLEANCHEKKGKVGVMQNFKRTLSWKGKVKKKKEEEEEERSVDDDHKTKSEKTEALSGEKQHVANRLSGMKMFSSGASFSLSLRPDKSAENENHLGDLHWPQLPLGVRFRDSSEEAFLSAVISYTNSSTVHFKLAPAYVLYMTGRSELHRPPGSEPPPLQRADRVCSVVRKMVHLTETVIQKQQTIASAQAFWMANTSELLNFLKQDKDLSLVTQNAQDALAHLVHKAFKCLIHCVQMDLRKHMSGFLVDPEREGELPAVEGVLSTLTSTMSLLRRSRVNPALTIQLFSQLFHFTSAWLFNRLMSEEAGALGLLSHYWGSALRQRLAVVEGWAERQGLELAANCHLGRVIQASTLLTMNKYSMQDAEAVQMTTFKLNSLQLRKLTGGYLYAANEPRIPPGLIDGAVAQAEASVDELLRGEGRDLHLPFLLPEGGYSCEAARGVPNGFREFMEPICRKGLCTLVSHPQSNGLWTVFFTRDSPPSSASANLSQARDPEVVTVSLKKPLNSGMGVSIVAAKGAGNGNLGIYVKSVVKGGPAEMDGRLAAGDQLLSVDGQSLVGLPQEKAAGIMMRTGPVVTLQVAKLGACFHGLEALLRQPPSAAIPDEGLRSVPEPRETTPTPSTEQSSSGVAGNRLGVPGRKKEQTLLKNRQLYRSTPSITAPITEGELVDPVGMGARLSAVSTSDICFEACRRECQTLPPPRSQARKTTSECDRPHQTPRVSFSPSEERISDRKTYMRHSQSQDNLCTGAPLVDKQWSHQGQGSGLTSHYSCVPIRSSISTHNLLSKHPPSSSQHQGSCHNGSGYWRRPAMVNPVTSMQPIRIDVPAIRLGSAHPPMTTFRQNTASLKAGLNQSPEGHEPPRQGQVSHLGPPLSNERHPRPSLTPQSVQQRPGAHQGQRARAQTVLPPLRHASPQSLPPLRHASPQSLPLRQRPGAEGPLGASQTQRERADSSGLSPDPWKRDAREKLEKQQRLRVVDLLEKEVETLRGKAHRSPQEEDRLRRVSLEWQFQKRVQEFQQKGDDDDDDDEDEDVDRDAMRIMQTLAIEDRTQVQGEENGRLLKHGDISKQGDGVTDKQDQLDPSTEDDKILSSGPEHRRSGSDKLDLLSRSPREHLRENLRREEHPEHLSFRERQHLFTLGSRPTAQAKAL